jgi:hypothetical protein
MKTDIRWTVGKMIKIKEKEAVKFDTFLIYGLRETCHTVYRAPWGMPTLRGGL